MHQIKHHVTVDATLASYTEGPRFVTDRKFPSGLSQFLAANISMAPWNLKKLTFR